EAVAKTIEETTSPATMGARRMIMLPFEAVRRQAYQIALIIDTTARANIVPQVRDEVNGRAALLNTRENASSRTSGPPTAVQRSCNLLRDILTLIEQPFSIFRRHLHPLSDACLVGFHGFGNRTGRCQLRA